MHKTQAAVTAVLTVSRPAKLTPNPDKDGFLVVEQSSLELARQRLQADQITIDLINQPRLGPALPKGHWIDGLWATDSSGYYTMPTRPIEAHNYIEKTIAQIDSVINRNLTE